MEKKTAVMAFGRLNPPTKGHQLLVDNLEKVAKQVGGEPMLFLSHKNTDINRDPLPYERKIYYCKKAFGDVVKESELNGVNAIIGEIYQAGYTDLIYLCGSDRVEEMMNNLTNAFVDSNDSVLVVRTNRKDKCKQIETEDGEVVITSNDDGWEDKLNYVKNNGNAYIEKSGNVLYKFNSVLVKQIGDDRVDEEVKLSEISATKVRQAAKDGDLELFKEMVPLDEETAEEMYNELRRIFGIRENIKLVAESMLKRRRFGLLNEDGEDSFSRERKELRGVGSLKDSYEILRQELINNDADEVTLSQFDDAVENIESITNSIDGELLTKLTKKLVDSRISMSASKFIKLMSPTREQLKVLLDKHELVEGSADNTLDDIGLPSGSEQLIERLVTEKTGKVGNSTAVGPFEFLLALVYDGYKYTSGLGDLEYKGQQVEVKHITSHAVIGFEIVSASNDSKSGKIDVAFGDVLESKGINFPTCSNLYNNIFNQPDNIKEFTREEVKPLLDLGVNIEFKTENGQEIVTSQELFRDVFKLCIDNYRKRFDKLILCWNKGIKPSGSSIIRVLPATDDLADILLKDYRITYENSPAGKTFAVSKPSTKSVFK